MTRRIGPRLIVEPQQDAFRGHCMPLKTFIYAFRDFFLINVVSTITQARSTGRKFHFS